MSLLELPSDVLTEILSYNMFPFCRGVCRELEEVEELLRPYREEHINMGGKCPLFELVYTGSAWEEFFFYIQYMMDTTTLSIIILMQVQRHRRNDIVLYLIDKFNIHHSDIRRWTNWADFIADGSKEIARRFSPLPYPQMSNEIARKLVRSRNDEVLIELINLGDIDRVDVLDLHSGVDLVWLIDTYKRNSIVGGEEYLYERRETLVGMLNDSINTGVITVEDVVSISNILLKYVEIEE